jgi:dienelactone hydrolase
MLKVCPFILAIFLLGACAHTDSFPVKTEKMIIPVKIDGKCYNLEGLLYSPIDGKGIHPLIIMTHGRNGPHPNINYNEVYNYRELNTALAGKGFLVLMVVRRGYGNSDGPDSEYLETAEASGLAGAEDIQAVADVMATKPSVDKSKVVIIGQSQGGWVSLACSTLGIPGLLGTINISGATNFQKANDKSIRSSEVEDQLCAAAGIYGKSAKVPTLWIYAENDNHLPASVHKWFDTFLRAGGKGYLVIKPPYKNNGHSIVKVPALFIEDIMRFFKEIGFVRS